MENDVKGVLLCIVAKRKLKAEIAEALHSLSVNFSQIVYGKGAVKAGFLRNILGLVTEENKVIFLCMTTLTKSDKAMDVLVEDFHFNNPDTGIAFTIPIEACSY